MWIAKLFNFCEVCEVEKFRKFQGRGSKLERSGRTPKVDTQYGRRDLIPVQNTKDSVSGYEVMPVSNRHNQHLVAPAGRSAATIPAVPPFCFGVGCVKPPQWATLETLSPLKIINFEQNFSKLLGAVPYFVQKRKSPKNAPETHGLRLLTRGGWHSHPPGWEDLVPSR